MRGGHKLRDVGAYVEGCRALQQEIDGFDVVGSGSGIVIKAPGPLPLPVAGSARGGSDEGPLRGVPAAPEGRMPP